MNRRNVMFLMGLVIVLIFTVNGNASTNAKELMQFTSGGHVLGFGKDSVYVAQKTHALKVQFVNAKGAMPATSEIYKYNQVPQLEKATYDNLWEGVTLVYEREKKGLVKSTYYVSQKRLPAIYILNTILR